MLNQAIYGSFLYGSKIYREYVSLVLYDFGIQTYNLNDNSSIIGINWELYKRDETISIDGLVDDTHILVDNGTSIESLIKINLNDYNLRDTRTDFYLKAWKDSNIKHLSEINIDYYPDDYVKRDKNSPYFYQKLGITEGISKGCIEVEPNRWQMVCIPIQYGYWNKIVHKLIHDGITTAKIKNYVIDQIEDVYGVNADTMIEVCNAYIGDNNFFYNYVVGVTPELSIHNFELGYQDSSCIEWTAFWIKSIHPTSFNIIWGE
jgi:hypothetical protein